MKRLISLIAMLAVMALPLVVLAGQGHGYGHGKECGCSGHGIKHGHGGMKHGHGGMKASMMKKMFKDAGLSDQQIRRIEVLHNEVDKKILDLHHQLETARLEKQQLMLEYAPEESKVIAILERMHGIQLELKKETVSLKLRCRKELTAEQWEKVRQLKAEHKPKHGKRCGKKHPHVK